MKYYTNYMKSIQKYNMIIDSRIMSDLFSASFIIMIPNVFIISVLYSIQQNKTKIIVIDAS